MTNLTPEQPAGGHRPPKRQPARAVLGGADVHTQGLAVPLGIDARGDQRAHVDHPTLLAELEHQGFSGDEGVGAGIQ